MKPFILFLRNLSGFFKRIRFWWEMPNFLTKNKNKGNFHHKFKDKINSPSENVKEIGIKPSKELRVYLEDEELSLLSELNNTTLSQVFHDFPSFFWILSPVLLVLFISLLLFPIWKDCAIGEESLNLNFAVCSYDSIMKLPINHSSFFIVIINLLFEVL